jgi:hypothetical protein
MMIQIEKLLQVAIINNSILDNIVPHLQDVETSREASNALKALYKNFNATKILSLRDHWIV